MSDHDTSKIEPQRQGSDELERILADAGSASLRSVRRALAEILHGNHLAWNVKNVADDMGCGPDGRRRVGGMRTITITLEPTPDAEEEPAELAPVASGDGPTEADPEPVQE